MEVRDLAPVSVGCQVSPYSVHQVGLRTAVPRIDGDQVPRTDIEGVGASAILVRALSEVPVVTARALGVVLMVAWGRVRLAPESSPCRVIRGQEVLISAVGVLCVAEG